MSEIGTAICPHCGSDDLEPSRLPRKLDPTHRHKCRPCGRTVKAIAVYTRADLETLTRVSV